MSYSSRKNGRITIIHHEEMLKVFMLRITLAGVVGSMDLATKALVVVVVALGTRSFLVAKSSFS